MKLDMVKFGAAAGILWGGGLLCLGILATTLNWGTPMMNVLGSLYLGYGGTPAGILIGTIWALADGFFAGFFLALIYNWFLGLGKK